MVKRKQAVLGLCAAAVLSASAYAYSDLHSSGGSARATTTTTHPTSNSVHQTIVAVRKSPKTPAKKLTHKNGTYTGVGETRIGAVQVQIKLLNDKITNVQITGYSTHYPISYIDPVLPQELLARQDVNKIDVVSGATLSTEDFYYAVQSCLQQAKNA